MASISTDKIGNKTMQFTGLDGKRKTVRLGKSRQRTVDTIKGHVEELLEAHTMGRSPYDETQTWLKKIHEKNSSLYEKLANLGLAPKQKQAQQMTLAPFLKDFLAKQSDKKPATLKCLNQVRNDLVEYFGAERALRDITEGDAEDFRHHLRTRVAKPGRQKSATARASQTSLRDRKPVVAKTPKQLQENTVRRRCGRARQIFHVAVRHRLIAANPFAEMKGVAVRPNRSRDYFVSGDEAAAVLAACPDVQWQLLFALSRYGGLRCPSEHLELTWRDIDLVSNTMLVRSPKDGAPRGKGK